MQGRLIRKLNVEELLKKALLSNFSLINELFTLKLFNRALLNLSGRLPFSSAELHKYQILETISNFISKNQMELFVLKVRARFIGKELTEMDNGRLGMVP